ncbi:Hypothetical predicted protein [Octopus vulgaris]|uniref:Uncharacterized protein n=1 Tax=Octopus vulgaris TaxID=6645 RepID=A0AA36FG12_OCTVU|nr:Hypothetical predicted protein [Octopus vulgaris]
MASILNDMRSTHRITLDNFLITFSVMHRRALRSKTRCSKSLQRLVVTSGNDRFIATSQNYGIRSHLPQD